jgi:hypothetical protein
MSVFVGWDWLPESDGAGRNPDDEWAVKRVPAASKSSNPWMYALTGRG